MAGVRNVQARLARARWWNGWRPAILGMALIASAPGGWMARVRAGEEGRRDEPPGRGGHRPAKPEAPHGGVRRFEIGQGPRSYWLFEPDKPRPDSAPVVVFLHGWFAVNPGFYGAWIDHLVRDGHVVIFPRYQNDVGTLPKDFPPTPWRRSTTGSECSASG